MPPPALHILYEDNHCLAIVKPAGALTTGYDGSEETLDRQVKAYLKAKHQKAGNVFLGVVHRLDRVVSGVLLFARTSKAAARLSEQFREGTVEKVYWAVVEGGFLEPSPSPWTGEGRGGGATGSSPPPQPSPVQGEGEYGSAGTLEDWLRKDAEVGRVEVVPPRTEGARQAVLHFQQRGQHKDLTWLEVRPQTGRKHQIRVQLASRGHPIYGDAKYGSVHTFGKVIALHARALTFLHPIRYEPVTLTAELPESWRRFHHLGLRAPP